jgi:succinate dehydrogenase / fumarate reductase iron-sulfur subunit
MDLTLKVWRQAGPDSDGDFKTYQATNVSPDASFLEMLDEVNEHLNDQG